jgi:hypothetical protein
MGPGTTIKTGGAGNSSNMNKSMKNTYYSKGHDIFSYGVVKEIKSDSSIIYSPLRNKIGSNDKFGIAYPFYNNKVLPLTGSIVPLVVGPALNIDNNPSNQYDVSTYYLDPVIINQTVNDNIVNTQSPSNQNISFKSSTLGTIPNIKPSETISVVYIPVLEKVFPTLSKGIKTLMTAQTQLEGFYPGSKSFRTNNPGNVYPSGNKNGFPTLEEGIQAQWTYILGACFNGTSRYYKPTDTLYKYLSTYAPASGGNDPYAYTKFIVGYFRKNGYPNVNENTMLEEIKKLS